jgi:carbonic anhydrase
MDYQNNKAAQQALVRLQDGHARWLNDRRDASSVSRNAAARIWERQDPFAVVVTCADSRMIPEILFDCGFGELFCIRTAGAVVSSYDHASIEYALSLFDIPLVLVMAHTGCGAVTAASQETQMPTASLVELVRHIRDNADFSGSVDEAAAQLASSTARSIQYSSALLIRESVSVVSCIYDMRSQEITYHL